MFKKDDQEIAPVDINHLVRDVLDLVQSEAQQQGVLVKAELADELPQIFGNRIQLQQVIRNLAINAIEAMDINAERERVLRVKSAIDRPNGLLITVEDTGTGIDPQNVERVFDAMFTTKSDGMGMGLSICRSIIEAHHGRLWVSPGVPHGAVFQFVLPITRA
jgi:signal transduction histidine kinase